VLGLVTRLQSPGETEPYAWGHPFDLDAEGTLPAWFQAAMQLACATLLSTIGSSGVLAFSPQPRAHPQEHTHMRRQIVSLTLIALGLVAVSTNVARAAEDMPNNILRFGLAWVVPGGDPTTIGDVTFETNDGYGFYADYERRIVPWFGLDTQILWATPAVDTLGTSGTTSNSLTVWTGSFGTNFHFFGRSRFDLYLGLFGSYTSFSETLDNAWGYGGVLGFDIALTKSGLAILMAVRYSQVGTNYVVSGNSASVDFDPLTYQLGLGWRF
jgi:outer membrane protein W